MKHFMLGSTREVSLSNFGVFSTSTHLLSTTFSRLGELLGFVQRGICFPLDDGKMVNVSLVQWMIMDFTLSMWLVTPFISHKKTIWKENKRT